MQFDEGVTGPTDRKNKKRTIKNNRERRAICPVMNPLTKSNAGELLLLEIELEPEFSLNMKERVKRTYEAGDSKNVQWRKVMIV